jgi:collagenase-like PrtC family protease
MMGRELSLIVPRSLSPFKQANLMNLTVATNWDEELIRQYADLGVGSVWGVMDKTPVGGGRPYHILAKVSKEQVEDYVKKVHAAGMKFDYLLNAPCMNNLEYKKETNRELIDHIEWISSIGVDGVVVTIPLIMEIVKEQFPKLEVRVSTVCHVNSVQRALMFEELGVDSITLDFNINRDFNLIRKIREAVKSKLIILANDGCLYQCAYRFYHYNIIGHASQTTNPLEGFYIDYCIIRCTTKRFSNKVELMKSRWIRPEDVHLYEEIGIDSLKVGGRRMSTAWLTNAARAYNARKYEGNLGDLLDISQLCVDPDMRSPQYKNFLSKSEKVDPEKIAQIGQLYPVKPCIDNEKLDGFIDFFNGHDCLSGCGTCNYCRSWAEKAVTINEEEASKYISVMMALLKDLRTSKVFHSEDKETAREAELSWNEETKNMMNELIQSSTPNEFKDIALMAIKSGSERNAKTRGSMVVEKEDLVSSLLRDTPSIFQAQMRNALKTRGVAV